MLSDLGFIKEKELHTYCKNNTRLGGHLSVKVPGVEIESGSLGHGLSVAAGMAWSCKLNNEKYKVIVILSDAELYEGSVWEALIFISHHKLVNLIIILDRNYQVVMGRTENFLKLEPLDKKLESFNYNVRKINGNNLKEITDVLQKFKIKGSKKPTFIIAETKKGKGIKFMENTLKWHHSIPSLNEFNSAMKFLKNEK
jgi:transketolase